jgi:hypothetical protein
MRRRGTAILLALVAAGTLSAAKPVPGEGAIDFQAPQPSRQAWRTQGVPVCIGRLREVRAFTPDDLETICGCTFDSYLEGHGTNPLPGLEDDHLPIAMETQLLNCTARTRPDQRAAVVQLNAVWPRGMRPPAPRPDLDAPKPVDQVDTGPPQSGNDGASGGSFRDWVRSLSLPDWLTGAPLLWVALGNFLVGLLILRVRGRDPRKDLVAPPSSMRRGAPPMPPRRPDLPR